MIGTGLIGGKSVGMLLARAILCRSDPRWQSLLEAHDSFYIGSDVFYSYLVENGCWWLRQNSGIRPRFWTASRRRGGGSSAAPFPRTSSRSSPRCWPISASRRSSSGPAACWRTTSATPLPASTKACSAPTRDRTQKRLADFVSAVRTIYASTMSEKALRLPGSARPAGA
jgi:pyruvate, water dikinase